MAKLIFDKDYIPSSRTTTSFDMSGSARWNDIRSIESFSGTFKGVRFCVNPYFDDGFIDADMNDFVYWQIKCRVLEHCLYLTL